MNFLYKKGVLDTFKCSKDHQRSLFCKFEGSLAFLLRLMIKIKTFLTYLLYFNTAIISNIMVRKLSIDYR